MDIANDLVESLMKRVVEVGGFSSDQHSDLFKEVSKFLFMYCKDNQANQRTLLGHLNFLV